MTTNEVAEGSALLNASGEHVGTYWRDGIVPRLWMKAGDFPVSYSSAPTRVWDRLRVGDFACVGSRRHHGPMAGPNGAPHESAMVGIVLDLHDEPDLASETNGVTRYVLVHCVQSGGIYVAEAAALCILEEACGLQHWRPVACASNVGGDNP